MASGIAKKMHLKSEYRILIINEPELDFVQVFAENRKELETYIAKAIESVKENGLFWVSYPKKSSKVKTDLSRDILREHMPKHGMNAVSLISINNIWSSMRFKRLS